MESNHFYPCALFHARIFDLSGEYNCLMDVSGFGQSACAGFGEMVKQSFAIWGGSELNKNRGLDSSSCRVDFLRSGWMCG